MEKRRWDDFLRDRSCHVYRGLIVLFAMAAGGLTALLGGDAEGGSLAPALFATAAFGTLIWWRYDRKAARSDQAERIDG